MLMDGVPGVITSQDDFGVNDAGLMITETTITQFKAGIPTASRSLCARARRCNTPAPSTSTSSIIKDGNNGGYANDWLIGDRKTGEIAYLELGLKNTPLWRTKDGYFVSSNFARDPEVIKDETAGFDPTRPLALQNARRVTWEKKMHEAKGRIDVDTGPAIPGRSRRQLHGQGAAPRNALFAVTWTR